MSTTFDFGPFFRSSVGFDRIFNLLEATSRLPGDSWPPYDIVKMADDQYAVTLALAGFTQDELSITHEGNLLVVAGEKQGGPGSADYLYRGIAGRKFEHRFELADHMKVTGADLTNGLLTIEMQREVPEAMKPRRIQIGNESAQSTMGEPKQIEGQKTAA